MRVTLAEFEGKSAWKYAREHWEFELPAGYEACVYKIENKKNGRCYVGHTTQKPYVRWYEHLRELILGRHLSIILQNSWNKHGIEAFEFSVIEYCAIEQRLIREQYWLDELNVVYNIAKVAGSTLGTKRTEADRKKFSEAQKLAGNAYKYLHTEAAQARHRQVVSSDEYKKKMSQVMFGRYISVETRKKMSETRKRMISEFGWKMPAMTEARKKQVSAQFKGKKKSPEHQAKINASLAATRARKAAKGLKSTECEFA